MKRIFFLLILLAIMIPVLSFADEIYIWIDKDGKHVTNTPPPKGAKVVDQSVYERSSQSEIEEFNYRQEAATNRGYQAFQNKQNAVQYDNYRNKVKSDNNEYRKQSAIEKAKSNLEREERLKSSYQDSYNKSISPSSKTFWNESVNEQQKKVDDAKHKLNEAENNNN